MFGSLGMPELLLILVIALIVFGPKKLPEVGRSLGKAMREFKRTTEEIKGKFEEQINAEEFKDLKSGLEGIKAEIKSATELPAEIKDLTRDITPARTETGATGAGETPDAPLTEPAPEPPMGEPETQVGPAPADSPAPAEVPAAPAPAAPPQSDPAPHPDSVPPTEPASPHGEG
jgi:sec-independent protein translocase protein TatA